MRCHGAVVTLGHKPIVTGKYAGLTAFLCIAVLTAGHCCLNSTVIVVTLSAYNLEANPPEEGVRNYTAVDKTPTWRVPQRPLSIQELGCLHPYPARGCEHQNYQNRAHW